MREAYISSPARYPVLRTVAILWMVGAVFSLIYCVFQCVVLLADAPRMELIPVMPPAVTTRIFMAVMWLVAGFFAVIINIGIAELIKLFINIEHNSRLMSVNSFTVAAGTAQNFGGRLSETAESELIQGR